MTHDPPRPTDYGDAILTAYLRRSYHAVDGLWFVKVEEALDFDEALQIDERVWEVLAKIQAREARALLGASGNTPDELARCFGLKLTADGHEFAPRETSGGVVFAISRCPWLELLRKSSRTHLALKVAQTICPAEGRAWCREFGGEYEFEMTAMACAGGDRCEMRFVPQTGDTP